MILRIIKISLTSRTTRDQDVSEGLQISLEPEICRMSHTDTTQNQVQMEKKNVHFVNELNDDREHWNNLMVNEHPNPDEDVEYNPELDPLIALLKM